MTNCPEFSYLMRNSRFPAEYQEFSLISNHSFNLPFLITFKLDMCITNYVPLVSAMELFVVVSILAPVDVISYQGFKIILYFIYAYH